MNEALKLVNDLNEEVFSEGKYEDEPHLFSYCSDGFTDIIMCADVCIWNSEDDDRLYIDEEADEYEPLRDYVIRESKNMFTDNLERMAKLEQ